MSASGDDEGPSISRLSSIPKTHKASVHYSFSEDDFREGESSLQRWILTLIGDKGVGTTFQALGTALRSFNGPVVAVSFDNKTARIRDEMYNDDRHRVHVINGLKYYADAQQDTITEAAAISLNYVRQGLRFAETKIHPDVTILDRCDTLEQMCEMKFRFNRGLGATDGFKNLNFWKERKFNLRSVFRAAEASAQWSVISTIRTELKEVVDSFGSIVNEKTPHWIDVIMQETDTAIELIQGMNGVLRRMEHRAIVRTNKLSRTFPEIATGTVLDLTAGKTIILKDAGKRLANAGKDGKSVSAPSPTEKPDVGPSVAEAYRTYLSNVEKDKETAARDGDVPPTEEAWESTE